MVSRQVKSATGYRLIILHLAILATLYFTMPLIVVIHLLNVRSPASLLGIIEERGFFDYYPSPEGILLVKVLVLSRFSFPLLAQ